MKELITALVKAQSEFPPVPKNKSNPFHKSKYADLDSILEVVTPILGKFGLAIVQLPETDFSVTYTHSETEKGVTTEFTHPGILLRTRLYHTSGDFIESTYPLQFDPNPQKRGSDVTYARRYALCALLSITADTDDDGNGASKGKSGQPTRQPTKPQNNGLHLPPEELEKSSKLFKELGWEKPKCVQYLEANFDGIQNRNQLSLPQHQELVKNLEQILEHATHV